MSDSAQVDAWWHGDGGQQQLRADGWVGDHPLDGGPVAHLLLHPAGHGAADTMRQLARALSLGAASDQAPIVEVPAEQASAWVDEDSVLHLHGPGAQLLERPVEGMWWSAATTRGVMVLSVGMDPLRWRPGDWTALDRYLDRRHRYSVGLITVRP